MPKTCQVENPSDKIEFPHQPDAIERLELWQAESPETRTYRLRRILDGGCLVELERHEPGHREVFCWGVEHPNVVGYKPDERVALSKQPGLPATIHAAIDKADELGL